MNNYSQTTEENNKMSTSTLKGVQCVGCNTKRLIGGRFEATRCGEVRQDGVCTRHSEQLNETFKRFGSLLVPKYNLNDGIYKLNNSNAYYKILYRLDKNNERGHYNNEISKHVCDHHRFSNPYLFFI